MSKKHRSHAGRHRSGTSQWHHAEVMTQSKRKTFPFLFFCFFEIYSYQTNNTEVH